MVCPPILSFGFKGDRVPVAAHHDRTAQITAIAGDMPLCERVQCDLMRMVVRIVDAAGDQRIARGHCVKQGGGRGGTAAVVADFDYIGCEIRPRFEQGEASSSFSASP